MKTFSRFTSTDRKLAFAAVALLATVKIGLWTLPFQRVIHYVKKVSIAHPIRRALAPRQVAWAVRLASRYVPGATCLPQALATQILLSWSGHASCLHIGVALAQQFEAHAWVEYDGRVVIGEIDETERYTPILGINSGHVQNKRAIQ